MRTHFLGIKIFDLAKNISIADTFILGPLLVLERMFEDSGIDRVLAKIAKEHPRLGFDLRKLVFTMVASRFVRPGSKLKPGRTVIVADDLSLEILDSAPGSGRVVRLSRGLYALPSPPPDES